MFDGNQHNWVILSFTKLLFNIPHGIAVVGHAVSKSIFKIIRRDNDHADVDSTVLEAVADMDNIASQQIASAGNLDLNSDSGNDGLVVSEPFSPIHIAGFCLLPIWESSERGVDRFPDDACAVCLFFIEDADVR